MMSTFLCYFSKHYPIVSVELRLNNAFYVISFGGKVINDAFYVIPFKGKVINDVFYVISFEK